VNKLCNAWLPLLCILVGGISLWLGWDGKIHPLNDGPYDNLRFLGMAETILNGDWLGSYNFLTLIRQPTYPLIAALNGLLGFPLHISQQAAYLGALALLVFALRNCDMPKWKAGLFFALCAFHPIAFYPHMFIISEAFYTTATIGVMAGCIGLWGALERDRPWHLFFWLGVLSAALPLLWHMRGESVWILPALVGFYGCYALKGLRDGVSYDLQQRWRRFALIILLPAMTTAATGMIFIAMNKSYYGIGVVYELTEPAFVRTSELLTHINAGPRIARVPVSHAALDAAYAVSPAMARLKPYFDRQNGGYGWSAAGCKIYGICNEIVAGWSLWALRDAVNSIGMYQSAETAHNFYSQIATELETACDNGRISCSSNPTGNLLYPPLNWSDILLSTATFAKVFKQFITFGILESELEAIAKNPADATLTARYNAITHDQNGVTVDELVISVHSLLRIYQVLHILGAVWLGGVFLWMMWGRFGRQDSSVHLSEFQVFMLVFLMLIIISRLGLFSLLDAISWIAVPRYLLVAYPAFLLLCVLALPNQFLFAKDDGIQ